MVLLFAVCAIGCRGPAQREVYSARMANEIRVLEDQLYDADYQNRVLQDELQRVKAACETRDEVPAKPRSSLGSLFQSQDAPTTLPYGPPTDTVPLSDHRAPLHDLPPPIIDDGSYHSEPLATPEYVPYDSGSAPEYSDTIPPPTVVDEAAPLAAPAFAPYGPDAESIPSGSGTREADPNSGKLPEPIGREPSGENGITLPAPRTPAQRPPAPIPLPPDAPEPPRNPNPIIHDVEPGTIKPPAFPGADPGGPDGRVNVPELDALRYSKPTVQQVALPNHIRLHTSLSGGHQFDRDDEVDGLYVVVNVVDENGRTLNLNNYDIQAGMTIVALDPKLDPNASRIGRWEFTPEEVSKFIRSIPVAGLHVPVKWQQIEPIGDEIVVYVRLQTDGEEMQCQGTVKLNQAAAMAKWMPRGGEPISR